MLRSFRQFLMLYALVRTCLWLPKAGGDLWLIASLVPLLAGLVLSFTKTWAYWAPRIALPAVAFHVVFSFPGTANHHYLELYTVLILCVAGADSKGDTLAIFGLRALVSFVLFHSGFQKLAYGYYFHGDFLSFMVGVQERFADIFSLVLPDPEVSRLQGYDMLQTGSGPYRVVQPLFIAVSNLVWLAELVLPMLLWWRSSRSAATWVAVAFIAVIQLGAREFAFATLMVGLLLLFLSPTSQELEDHPALAAFRSSLASSEPWKRAVTLAVLVAAGLWPFAHRLAVPRYDLHPWRFGGWAMYAIPTPPPLVAVFELSGGKLNVVNELELPANARNALLGFRQQRNSLGACAVPDGLAGAIFSGLPAVSSLGVIVQKMTLDRETARMTSAKTDYWYERTSFEHTGTHTKIDLLRATPDLPD